MVDIRSAHKLSASMFDSDGRNLGRLRSGSFGAGHCESRQCASSSEAIKMLAMANAGGECKIGYVQAADGCWPSASLQWHSVLVVRAGCASQSTSISATMSNKRRSAPSNATRTNYVQAEEPLAVGRHRRPFISGSLKVKCDFVGGRLWNRLSDDAYSEASTEP
jgi:hypothetical protein